MFLDAGDSNKAQVTLNNDSLWHSYYLILSVGVVGERKSTLIYPLTLVISSALMCAAFLQDSR